MSDEAPWEEDGPYCWLCSGFGPHDGGRCEVCGEGNGDDDDDGS